jgi:hypothetical protein
VRGRWSPVAHDGSRLPQGVSVLVDGALSVSEVGAVNSREGGGGEEKG